MEAETAGAGAGTGVEGGIGVEVDEGVTFVAAAAAPTTPELVVLRSKGADDGGATDPAGLSNEGATNPDRKNDAASNTFKHKCNGVKGSAGASVDVACPDIVPFDPCINLCTCFNFAFGIFRGIVRN